MERRAEPGGVAGMEGRCASGRILPGIREACGSTVPLEAQPRSGAEGAGELIPKRQVLDEGRMTLEVDV